MTSARATIFALSSGRPPAAIAVVRMSGAQSSAALTAMIGRLPEPRKATLARVRDPATGEAIDQALALWFPAPASETGEDMAELQLHGGRAVIAAALSALGKIEGLRPAEPGEFTRRAFEAGRLDLTQAEGLGDLIAAETEAQRRQALAQLRGLLGDRAERWRKRLIEALGFVEAAIDFADEADVPPTVMEEARAIVRALTAEISKALEGAERGERLRDGLWVVIAGPPNAGKSTLLNRIARREAAIVAPTPGTTRDVIEVHLDLDGYPVNLLDTAGLRDESEDPIEREGMRRARAAAAHAHLVLWVVDATAADASGAHVASLAAPLPEGTSRWIVVNKIDLLDARTIPYELSAPSPRRGEGWGEGGDAIERHEPPHPSPLPKGERGRAGAREEATGRVRVKGVDQNENWYRISAVTGAGCDALLAALARYAEACFTGEPALVTRARQQAILSDVLAALNGATALADAGAGEELVAEQLRHAATGLGRLTGRVDVEDILDVIFREFCVGK